MFPHLTEHIDRLLTRLWKVTHANRPFRSKRACRDDQLRLRRLRRREAARTAARLREWACC